MEWARALGLRWEKPQMELKENSPFREETAWPSSPGLRQGGLGAHMCTPGSRDRPRSSSPPAPEILMSQRGKERPGDHTAVDTGWPPSSASPPSPSRTPFPFLHGSRLFLGQFCLCLLCFFSGFVLMPGPGVSEEGKADRGCGPGVSIGSGFSWMVRLRGEQAHSTSPQCLGTFGQWGADALGVEG